MDNEIVQDSLDAVWQKALVVGSDDPNPEVDRLINSPVVSIRYAVVTQMPGKVHDPNRSLMFFQSGEDEDLGAWNARSFCDAVVVPWVAKNHDVLGTSQEPYASKPLRRVRLERDMDNVRNRAEWNALYDYFAPLEEASPDELELEFERCLESVARRLAKQSFKYQIPTRIALPVLCGILEEYLSEPSGGHRALAISTAVMHLLGDEFSLFARVDSQGLNEADVASGAPGDIMCYDESGDMILAVEVKDRNLALMDVTSSTRKVREAGGTLTSLLFAVPGLKSGDKTAIHESASGAWATGLNIYQAKIVNLVYHSFVLLPEDRRPKLLRQIGNELNKRGDHTHRRAWHDILSKLAE